MFVAAMFVLGYSGQEMYSIIRNEVDVEPGGTGHLDRYALK